MNRSEFDEAVNIEINKAIDRSGGCYPWGCETEIRVFINEEESLEDALIRITDFLRTGDTR